jgi:quercetin dioxygenase-like cupin family protein
MIKGWFVGAFEPTSLKTTACEVAVKHYPAGASEALHHHKVATEVTLVLAGRIVMMDKEWVPGDILVLDPGEATTFRAITEATIVVVKVPGAENDKFEGRS